jgi:hypothetical protein
MSPEQPPLTASNGDLKMVAMLACELHQGVLHITSRPGEGTRVVAELPTSGRMLYY